MLITRTRVTAAAVVTALALTSFTATPASARHWNRGNAAAIAAFAGIVGTVAALAARDRYDDGPYYAAPAYGPYGGPVYAAPRWGYRHHHWHR